MGAADIVPGVSGGTIALIAGIYEHLVPKTVFVIKDDISAEERVKGTVDKIKNSLNEMGEIENMVSTFKRAVGVEK